ncbi:polyketide cyclase [Leptospira wolffii]|uniref:Polyketide cyclase n=1 Tax=Leptospira wolffii TaxID=409998 RepID=A0A2M9ZAS4_9LEPT|nr:START domain-containing protein [Leptospira wolffii]PJZ65519.1 polyketide cyclase [Leptospira wolffii]
MIRAVCSAILLLLVLQSSAFGEKSGWEENRSGHEVVVYVREYPGSRIKEFLGVTEISASLSQIVAILSDPESCSYIYTQCKEITVLSGTEKSSIIYTRNQAPWPVNDRDIVITRKLEQDPKTKAIYIRLAKTDAYPKEPPSGTVRMADFQSQWTLVPTKEGTVKIEFQGHLEPGGNIPDSIINVYTGKNPYNTLVNLRKAVDEGRKKDIKVAWLKEISD